MGDGHEKNREPRDFGFATAVREHLAPLLMSRGFVCAESSAHAVRFRSGNVVMAIWHDPFSYEIAITFARVAKPAEEFGLGEMLAGVLGTGHTEETIFQASDPGRVDECLKAIVETLKTYGEGILGGDPTTFEQTGESTRRTSDAFTKQVMQGPARRAAEDAWRARDYGKVRELYSSMTELTAIEQKRLAYSQAPRVIEEVKESGPLEHRI